YGAYRQFPQGGWCYGAKNQPAGAEGSPPPSENFSRRPNLSAACNRRTRTERPQPATERATGTRPASAWLAHAQHGTRLPDRNALAVKHELASACPIERRTPYTTM